MIDDTCRVRITDIANRVYGVKTEIDGKELPLVRRVTFEALPDEPVMLNVDMFVDRSIDIDVSAKVTINIVAAPGAQIFDVTSHDDPEGTRRLVVTYPEKHDGRT